MEPTKKARSLYWDIVKGWGIIAIVLGHTGYFAGAFVYLFHLALFFFITGYFYNEKKYGDTPFLYFGTRLAGVWPRYMFYTLIFVLLHNFFVRTGIYAGQELYNNTRKLTAWMYSLSFNSMETVQGALWFVPVWLVSSGLFAGCVRFSRLAAGRIAGFGPAGAAAGSSAPVSADESGQGHIAPQGLKLWLAGLSCLGVGIIGVFFYGRYCTLPYNLHAALLVVPLYFLAWMMQLLLPGFRRCTVWFGCLISAVLLYLINSRLHIYIDLASLSIPGLLYYPISLLGIYFVLSLSAVTERFALLAKLLAFLGRYSFDIMAIHFTLFKFLDYGYARFVLGQIPENISSFPVSFRWELGPLYLACGLLLPALFGWVLDRVVDALRGPQKETS